MGDRYWVTMPQLEIAKDTLEQVKDSLIQSHDPPSAEDVDKVDSILELIEGMFNNQLNKDGIKCVACNAEAEYVYDGYSYCNKHLSKHLSVKIRRQIHDKMRDMQQRD